MAKRLAQDLQRLNEAGELLQILEQFYADNGNTNPPSMGGLRFALGECRKRIEAVTRHLDEQAAQGEQLEASGQRSSLASRIQRVPKDSGSVREVDIPEDFYPTS